MISHRTSTANQIKNALLPTQSYRPVGTGVFFDIFQAFHAWLPSFSPFGTQAPVP
jgi:hypothetical protein